LIDQARREVDPHARKLIYAEVQRILAEELPSINLWYLDNVLVHNKRVRNLRLNPAGNYDFPENGGASEPLRKALFAECAVNGRGDR